MSGVLSKLLELEQQSRQLAARGVVTANATGDERAAEADALARAAAEDRARAAAESCQLLAAEHIAVMQRRLQAEDLAAKYALSRAAAETTTETTAAQQAHIERLAESALRTRIEAEKCALVNAQHREFAAAELAIAVTARAKKEEELARLAQERVAAERHIAKLAAEKIRAEQIAEAAALARMASEREMTREARRRAEQEIEAGCAAAARLEAEHEAGVARTERIDAEEHAAAAAANHNRTAAALATALSSVSQLEPTGSKAFSSKRLSPARLRLLASTAVALMAGVGAGMWLGKTPAIVSGSHSAEQMPLRLDDKLTSVSTRMRREVPQDQPARSR